jgi:thiol-disulfide isomerase/thioredoxin
MTFADAIRIGPVAVPIRYLVLIASAVLGAGVVWFLFRRRRRVRRTTMDLVSNAALLFFAAWKLSPVFTQGAALLREPLLLLYAPGGTLGTILGIAAVAAYGVFLWLRRRRDLVHTSPALVVFAATAVFAWLLGTTTVDLIRANHVEAGAEQSPAGTGAGANAPGFALPALSGDSVQLEDLRGKPVVLTFWATWCGPCRAETPAKKRLHEQWGDRLHVVGVNLTHTEPGPDTVAQYVEEAGVDYRILLDRRGRISSLYNLFGTPTTVVIDRDGVVVSRRFGPVSYDWLVGQVRGLVAG